MIGRVKVTTSIERSVSLYTPPDKNTSNVKHVAFSIRRKNAPGAFHFGADRRCTGESICGKPLVSAVLVAPERVLGVPVAEAEARVILGPTRSTLHVSTGLGKGHHQKYILFINVHWSSCVLVFIYLLRASSAFLMVLLTSGQVGGKKWEIT